MLCGVRQLSPTLSIRTTASYYTLSYIFIVFIPPTAGLSCLTCLQSPGTTQLDNFRVTTRLNRPVCPMEPIRCDRDQNVCVTITMHIGGGEYWLGAGCDRRVNFQHMSCQNVQLDVKLAFNVGLQENGGQSSHCYYGYIVPAGLIWRYFKLTNEVYTMAWFEIIARGTKIKCSNNEFYRVKPVYAFVEPKGTTKLEVLRLAGPPKEDKLQILWAEAPVDETDPTGPFKAGAQMGDVIVPLKAT